MRLGLQAPELAKRLADSREPTKAQRAQEKLRMTAHSGQPWTPHTSYACVA